jgi:adenine C2-methylase RlmN of 23S rRNA A2503 and tRNA A37
MEVYRTQDGQVSKYVHDDGSETAIKTVSSCANVYDKETGKIVPIDVDREKFSVFVSSSVGCPIGCKFCYLTIKKFPYHKLSVYEIVNNFREALKAEVEFKPEIRKKYMKIGWMGMGDAFLLPPNQIPQATESMLEHADSLSFTRGLDGVDISTVLPPSAKGWPHFLGRLNHDLSNNQILNPHNKGRSPLRLFYSLHATSERRKDLIPVSGNAWSDLEKLCKFGYWYGIDIIIHHMFLEGINDTRSDVECLEVLIKRACPDAELRILRYNECQNSPFKESPRFDELTSYAAEIMPKVKYQVSAGSEIKASYGQFLCVSCGKEK